MAIQIQYRRDTAANWTSVNPILAEGEPGYETDTGKFKVGNGSSTWSALSYSSGPTGATGPAGPGVAVGGTAGQVLAKIDATNYNTQWVTPASGTVTSVNGTGTVNGITLSGSVTASGSLTLAGTLGGIANSQLTNSAITINGTSTALGGTINVGTVTSVTASAPVVSSGGTTPVISMAKATSLVDGYLSATDWSTFNSKQPAGTYATGTGSASGTNTGDETTATIKTKLGAANTTTDGYLTSTDWNTFNGKQSALVSGTNIKTVNGTSLLGAGDVPVGVLTVTGTAPVVSSGGANPAISMAAANTTTSGYLTSTDWNTFNNKQPAGSYITSGGTLGTPSSGTLTNCTGLPVGGISATGTPSSTTYLRGDGTWSTVAGGSATPGGSTTQVQYNSAGAFAGSANFTFDGTALTLASAPTNTVPAFNLTGTPNAAAGGKTGVLAVGPDFTASDKNIMATFVQDINDYTQVIIQNPNAGASASSDIVLNNNNTTGAGTYANLGINSSGWTGTAGTASLNAANMVYLTSTGGDLTIGTTTSNAIRFITNSGADKLIFDANGNVGIGIVPTNLDLLELGAGTTSKAPLGFTAGSLLTTSDPGSVEYDGTAWYFTPTGTARALTNTSYYYRKNTATTLTSATGNQSILTLTNGVTVAANTIYEVEMEFQLTTSGTTSHTESFGFTLATATVTNMGVTVNRLAASTTSSAIGAYLTSVTPVAVTGALTTAQNATYRVKGTIAFGTAGSINPVLAFSAAPGGTSTVAIGSWMKLTPIGTTGSNVAVGTWA